MTFPSGAGMRAKIFWLTMDPETRGVVEQMRLEEAGHVDILSRLLRDDALASGDLARLIGRLQDAGAKPSRGVLDSLAAAVRAAPGI